MRSFLEIDSGILDEVCEVMVTEVAYEVEYSMADAFIILPLMNIIHEVAVDGLMEMTPDPEQLHKELLAGSYGLHDELYAEQMAILAAQQAEEARLAEEERVRLEHEAKEAAAAAEKDRMIGEEETAIMHLMELETILYNKQKASYDSEIEVQKRERKIARKIAKREALEQAKSDKEKAKAEARASKKAAKAEAKAMAEEERYTREVNAARLAARKNAEDAEAIKAALIANETPAQKKERLLVKGQQLLSARRLKLLKGKLKRSLREREGQA